MEIRKAQTSDLDDLIELNQEVHAVHLKKRPEEFKELSAEDIRSSLSYVLSQKSTEILVCCSEEKVVGYILVQVMNRPENRFQKPRTFLYIDQIDVKEEYRRQGVGKLLLDAARGFAIQQGLNLVTLDVWKFNVKAVSFFRSQGFKPWIERMAMSME